MQAMPGISRARFSFLIPISLFFITITATALPAASPPAVNISADAKILIINSYHHGYDWSDNELTGILKSFSDAGLKNGLYLEYLDSKHFADSRHFEQLRNLFSVKYAGTKFALVLAMDNPAFDFAIRYRKELFRGVPIVFIGMNDFEPAMLKGESNVTGVVERQDIAGTVKAAMVIHPDLKEVVIVHDYTSSGLASRDEARDQLAPLADRLRFRYLPEMTIEEVKTELGKLQPGSIVLPFSFSRDKAGKVFNHPLLAEILSKSSPVPVYGTKVERLGFGIVGGSLLEGTSHGAMGAELALRILKGEKADNIPIVTEPTSKLFFDNIQLKRFSIDIRRLTAGSMVINKPQGIYEQHGTVINIAGAIILFLSASLAFVIIANRRRKMAEAALLESERNRARELETSNKEMESFCYAVSHDLQVPLRHINSFSNIIQEEYKDRLDTTGQHYFTRIRSAIDRMGDLIKDMLKLSQISREEIRRREFDLTLLANEILEELQMNDFARHVRITVDEGMKAEADRQLVRVVLDNLIGNSWKYTSKTVDARIHVGMKLDDERTAFFVADNGVGFDMQFADKLFTPFQRFHDDSEFTGSGIGLATVQRVIHRHGGDVWADAKPDRGATFFFTLKPR